MRAEAIHAVETPEYVVFEFELAGLVSRALAWGIDALVMMALGLVMALVLGIVSIFAGTFLGSAFAGFGLAITFVAVFLLQFGYFVILEWAWRGQTVGKRALGLRVLQDSGVRVGFYEAMLRNLLRVIDSLPATYLVGAISMLMGRRHQRLGDLLAGTVVVCEKKRPLPSAVVPLEERYNSFLEDRRALSLARSRVSPALREILTSLSLRREELDLEARLALFARLAEHLSDLGVPRPRALSDERFVLNATAAVLGATAQQPERPDPAFAL